MIVITYEYNRYIHKILLEENDVELLAYRIDQKTVETLIKNFPNISRIYTLADVVDNFENLDIKYLYDKDSKNSCFFRYCKNAKDIKMTTVLTWIDYFDDNYTIMHNSFLYNIPLDLKEINV